jgi:hypothetical protein
MSVIDKENWPVSKGRERNRERERERERESVLDIAWGWLGAGIDVEFMLEKKKKDLPVLKRCRLVFGGLSY